MVDAGLAAVLDPKVRGGCWNTVGGPVEDSSVSESSAGLGGDVAMVEVSSNVRMDVSGGCDCKACEYRLDSDTSSVARVVVDCRAVSLLALRSSSSAS